MNLDASAAAVETAWKDYWAKRENAAADSPDSPDAPDASEQPVPDPKPEAQNPDEPIEVTLEAQELPAKVTFEAVRQVDGLLAAYSTTYGGIANRLHNVELAASRINGVMVRPGEVFSYNTVVGPRTRRAGFLEAPEIVRGRHQMGVGGGVCQVSSTLYNAVLRANLKVVQRAHHAFPIGYVPHGCDATVAYGAIDFQFQNDTDIPIYITATTNRSRRRLTFRIFGKTVPGREVSIQTGNISSYPYTTITRTDSSLPAGRRIVEARGHSGLRVTVTRVIKENGEVVRREVVSRDHYRAVPAIVVVGTGARPSPTTSPPPADTTAPAAPAGTPEE
jgi:vancomycin resistance protein YoaR